MMFPALALYQRKLGFIEGLKNLLLSLSQVEEESIQN